MGDPKKHRRKYIRPQHPWKAYRIRTETDLGSKYGLANRREIWKASSEIARYRANARGLMILSGEEAEEKKQNLMGKLRKLGLLDSDALDDVLKLTTQDLLERRLQTLVYRKGLANTMNQARQFVTHGHVLVNGKVTDIPGYVVRRDLEDTIELKDRIKRILQEEDEEQEEEGETSEVKKEEKKQEKTKKKAEKTEEKEKSKKTETKKEEKKQEESKQKAKKTETKKPDKEEKEEEKKQEKTEKTEKKEKAQEKETKKKQEKSKKTETKKEEKKQEKTKEEQETKKAEEKEDKSKSNDSEDKEEKKDKS